MIVIKIVIENSDTYWIISEGYYDLLFEREDQLCDKVKVDRRSNVLVHITFTDNNNVHNIASSSVSIKYQKGFPPNCASVRQISSHPLAP